MSLPFIAFGIVLFLVLIPAAERWSIPVVGAALLLVAALV